MNKAWPFLDIHVGNMKCDFPCSAKPEPAWAGLISLLSPVFVLRKSKHALFLLSSKEKGMTLAIARGEGVASYGWSGYITVSFSAALLLVKLISSPGFLHGIIRLH